MLESVNPLRRHAFVAELVRHLRAAGSWCSRTHIQKVPYVFQTLFEPEESLRYPYVLYKHGVYSFELDEDVAEMVFYGGLTSEPHPGYGPRYSAPGAEGLLQRFGDGIERWDRELEFVASEVGILPVRGLEALTTVIYVATDPHERVPHESVERQLARVRELKPHLSDAEVAWARQKYVDIQQSAQELRRRVGTLPN